MSDPKIVRMANEIASFFRAYPEETAVAEIEKHLHDFWPRIMRLKAIEALDAGEPAFDPLVVKALQRLRSHTEAGAGS